LKEVKEGINRTMTAEKAAGSAIGYLIHFTKTNTENPALMSELNWE